MINNSFSKRPIRSFVRRQSRISSAQIHALEVLWAQFGLNLEQKLLNFNQIFGRSNSETVLEIGFGNGQSLLAQAQANPQTNFIGIEVHKPGIGSLLQGLEAEKLNNVRIFQNDAVEVLSQCVPPHSLDKIQIFFPDPWPKLRHHKRRLIQMDFADLLHQCLKLGGLLHLATDWDNYAEHMLSILGQSKNWQNHNTAVTDSGENHASLSRPITKFEQRGVSMGYQIRDLIFSTI